MDVLWQEFVDCFTLVSLMGAGTLGTTGDPGVLDILHDLVKSFLWWGMLIGFVVRPWRLRTDDVGTKVCPVRDLSIT